MDTLHWVKCQGDAWCSLERLKLDSVNAEGVYLIWHAGEKPRVVRLGQGNIADRLGVHRADSQILAYKKYGDDFTNLLNEISLSEAVLQYQ